MAHCRKLFFTARLTSKPISIEIRIVFCRNLKLRTCQFKRYTLGKDLHPFLRALAPSNVVYLDISGQVRSFAFVDRSICFRKIIVICDLKMLEDSGVAALAGNTYLF